MQWNINTLILHTARVKECASIHSLSAAATESEHISSLLHLYPQKSQLDLSLLGVKYIKFVLPLMIFISL